MKIWKLEFDANKYNNIVPINTNEWEALGFDGSPLLDSWKPIAFKTLNDDLELGDTPSLISTVPVLSEYALNVLKDLIEGSVEILPIRLRVGKFFILNVTDVLDCVDYDKSEVKPFKSSGRIMRFIKYEFFKECLYNKHIFKIPDESKRNAFVSDQFKERVKENKLKGFKFELV